MTSVLNYLYNLTIRSSNNNQSNIVNNSNNDLDNSDVDSNEFHNVNDDQFTVAVAESVTAGALANVLCSEPGASHYFKGGVVAYSIQSKKDILGIDIDYAEKNNFANPFTTLEMAKAIVKKFNARIGIATTGYSLPMKRDENKEKNQCALDIKNPYAYVCLYDSVNNYEKIYNMQFEYKKDIPDAIQRATVQSKVSLEAKKIYLNYKESMLNKESPIGNKNSPISKRIIYL